MMHLNKRNIFQSSSRIKITIAIHMYCKLLTSSKTNANFVGAESPSITISQENIILGACPFIRDVQRDYIVTVLHATFITHTRSKNHHYLGSATRDRNDARIVTRNNDQQKRYRSLWQGYLTFSSEKQREKEGGGVWQPDIMKRRRFNDSLRLLVVSH